MLHYPPMKNRRKSTEMIQSWGGLNEEKWPAENEFADMRKMTGEHYPLAASLPGVGYEYVAPAALQGMLGGDAIAYVAGGTLYLPRWEEGVVERYTATKLNTLNPEGEKQMVWMGANILIWPDKMWYNTADHTFGSMESRIEGTSEGTVGWYPCESDGTIRVPTQVGTEAPEVDASTGEIVWLDTSGETPVLKVWEGKSQYWRSVTDPCIMLYMADGEVGAMPFEEGDTVTIYWPAKPEFDGNHILRKVEDARVMISNTLPGTTGYEWTNETSASFSMARTVPEMDFVTQAQNRIWGCRYGETDEGIVNELYCCKLGDFKNWNTFAGISTDAWRGSRGIGGAWTGVATVGNYPVFFKAGHLEKVYISSSGAHQVVTMDCQGCTDHKSLAVVDGVLYYKHKNEVYAYDGDQPELVSGHVHSLPEDSGCPGCGWNHKYYLGSPEGQVYTLDTRRGLWHKGETLGRKVQFIVATPEEIRFGASVGTTAAMTYYPALADDGESWMLQSGPMGYSRPDRKYVSRLQLRLSIQEGGYGDLFIRYDSGREWELVGHITGTDLVHTALVAVRPRRCDHFELKMEGKGEFRLYSLTKQLEEGGDTP